jgi:hypothetical protein
VSKDPAVVVEEIASGVSPSDIEAEISALTSVVETFDRLDQRARRRVLAWARDRYWTDEVTTGDLMDHMNAVSARIGEHQKATKQPSQADRALWESIRGTRYWTDDEESSVGSLSHEETP